MLKRKTTVSLVTLVVFALCLGVLFQYSTTRTLALAEALQFRRMQVAAQEDGTYRFFFATNRTEANPESVVEERFTTERRDSLEFGFFDT